MADRTSLLKSPKYLPIQECNYSLKAILSLKTVIINLSCNNSFYSKFLKIHKIILRTAAYHLLEDLIQIYSCQILSLNHLNNFPSWRQTSFTWPVEALCPLPSATVLLTFTHTPQCSFNPSKGSYCFHWMQSLHMLFPFPGIFSLSLVTWFRNAFFFFNLPA